MGLKREEIDSLTSQLHAIALERDPTATLYAQPADKNPSMQMADDTGNIYSLIDSYLDQTEMRLADTDKSLLAREMDELVFDEQGNLYVLEDVIANLLMQFRSQMDLNQSQQEGENSAMNE